MTAAGAWSGTPRSSVPFREVPAWILGALAPILWIQSLLYGAVVRFRNLLFDAGVLRPRKPPVPVISIGNLTVGGTGKTPLVAYLAREAMRRGFRPAVLARGYRGEQRGRERINDEGIMLEEAVPGLVVIQDPDRVRAAARAVQEHAADLILLDDGFQHRRIGRDLDIVAADGLAPLGNRRLLPAGPLREPAAGLRRAAVVVLTRCGEVAPAALADSEAELRAASGAAAIFRTDHVAERLRCLAGGEILPLGFLQGRKVFLFCGIGAPWSFLRTAARLGADVKGSRLFADHHRYSPADVAKLGREAAAAGAELLLTTAKDGVKVRRFPEAERCLALDIAVVFREREREFLELAFGSRPPPAGAAPGARRS